MPLDLSAAEQAVRRSLEQAKRQADRARRELASVLLDYYHNDMADDSTDVLGNVFAHPEEKLFVAVNPIRKMVQTKAQMFQEDPEVMISTDGEEPNDPDQELWDHIVERGQWYDGLRDADAMVKLLGTVHLYPRPLDEDGYLDLAIVTPDVTQVVQRPDAPHRAAAILYKAFHRVETVVTAGREEWVVWYPDWHFTVDEDGGYIKAPGRKDTENPYKLIPLLKLDDRRPKANHYFGTGALDMLTVNRAVNAMLVALAHGEINSGWVQMLLRNVPKELAKKMGPDSPFVVEGQKEGDIPAGMEGLHLASDLDKMRGAIQFLIEQAVLLNNVPPQEFRTDAPTESGFAKMVQRLPLLEERKRDVPKWRRNMKGLFRIVKAVWNYEITRPEFEVDPAFKRPFSDKSELLVDFIDPVFPESELEKLERYDKAIDMGLLSRVDAMIRVNPDLDEDAAKAKLLDIAYENQKFKGANLLAELDLLPDRPTLTEQ